MGIKETLRFLEENSIKWVDLQFTDLNGRYHHITVPSSEFDDQIFKTGFAKLDGSSIKGFTTINESDMLLVPIPETITSVRL